MLTVYFVCSVSRLPSNICLDREKCGSNSHGYLEVAHESGIKANGAPLSLVGCSVLSCAAAEREKKREMPTEPG
jgi:hypothetical protein